MKICKDHILKSFVFSWFYIRIRKFSGRKKTYYVCRILLEIWISLFIFFSIRVLFNKKNSCRRPFFGTTIAFIWDFSDSTYVRIRIRLIRSTLVLHTYFVHKLGMEDGKIWLCLGRGIRPGEMYYTIYVLVDFLRIFHILSRHGIWSAINFALYMCVPVCIVSAVKSGTKNLSFNTINLLIFRFKPP